MWPHHTIFRTRCTVWGNVQYDERWWKLWKCDIHPYSGKIEHFYYVATKTIPNFMAQEKKQNHYQKIGLVQFSNEEKLQEQVIVMLFPWMYANFSLQDLGNMITRLNMTNFTIPTPTKKINWWCSLPTLWKEKTLAHFVPYQKILDDTNIANFYFQEMFKLHEHSITITSDRDNKILGYFGRALWSKLGTRIPFSSQAHSQTYGLIMKFLWIWIMPKTLLDWENDTGLAYQVRFNQLNSPFLFYMLFLSL